MRRNFPSALVGYWYFASHNRYYHFTSEGVYRVVGDPASLSISPDGQKLTWGGYIFNRTGGSGTTIVGTWLEDAEGIEEYHFRSDNTYSGLWYDDHSKFQGAYTTEGSTRTSTIREAERYRGNQKLRQASTASPQSIIFFYLKRDKKAFLVDGRDC